MKDNNTSPPVEIDPKINSPLGRRLLPSKSTPRPSKEKQSHAPKTPAADPLLDGLTTLLRLHGTTVSIDTVLDNLPYFEPGEMPLSLFMEAATQAGLQVRLVKRPLHAITVVMPVLLLLKNNKACILTEISENKATIILPEISSEARRVPLSTLVDKYTGHAVFAMPALKDDAPAQTARSDRKPASSHWLWGPILSEWRNYAHVIFASLTMNLFGLATPLYVKNIYDRVIPHNSMDTLTFLTMGLILVFIFDFTLKLIRGRFIDTTGKKIDMRLETAFYNKILNLKAGSYTASCGSLVNSLRELETLRNFFTSATLTTFVDLPFIFIFIALFAYIGGPIAYIFLLSIPVIVLAALAIHYPLQRCIEKSYAAGTQKHSILIETIANFEAVKTQLCAPTLRKRWNGNVAESAKQSVNLRTLSMASITFSGIVQQFSYAGIFLIGVYLVGKGEMTVGGLIACSILSGRITGPLIKVAQLLTQVHHTLNSYRELNHIMKFAEERPAEKVFLQRSDFTGSMEFSRVGFSYPDTNIPVLENVNLKIRAGEKVGIIGRTGSGKSTLEKLLLGLYEPKEGAVLLEGTDLRQIDPLAVRRHIGYVPQDVELFRGTVRSNIKIGHPAASDEEMLRAADLAGISPFLKNHPAGFDLPINEQGGGLSGGQRQAVSIARALIGNPPILAMDEPTSSMDNRSEAAFIANLRPWLSRKTLILVTHRESLLALVDRIVIMDNGKIVADGPKDKIMAKLFSGNIQVKQTQ